LEFGDKMESKLFFYTCIIISQVWIASAHKETNYKFIIGWVWLLIAIGAKILEVVLK
jgi:hypothetical protein